MNERRGYVMGGKKILITSIITLVILLTDVNYAFASVPYSSYAYGPDGEPFRIQTPYMPVNVIGNILYKKDAAGSQTKVNGLNNPNDICIDGSDNIYVADTGDNRIVKMNDSGILLKEYGTGNDPKAKLNSPEGIYVSASGDVYVADTGNQRIVVFNPDGSFKIEYKKPGDVSLKNIMFVPIHVTIDLRGFLFVVVKGCNEGIVVFSPDGKFQGFFGRNVTQLPLIEKIKRRLFTKQQLATNSNKEASSVSNLYIGNDHYVYTCTEDVTKGQIKKLNSQGEDLLDQKKLDLSYIDTTNGNSSIAGLVVDKNGIIYAIDRANGIVFIFDNNGQALASFGAKLTGNQYRIGCFSSPTGIAVNSKGMIYVLDQTYNGIHIFKPTTFMNEVLTATTLYNNGDDADAKPYWEDILKKNVFYYKANMGLGLIAYENGQWAEAMHQAKIAKNQPLYSDAMWQLRVLWIQKNINYIALGVAALLLFMIIKSRLNSKKFEEFKKRIKQ